MKKLLIAVLLMQVSVAVMAQDKTLLISESGLPYTAQTWFAYGSGNIDQNDIVGCWDQGKRIVTAAYTGEGWFVIMQATRVIRCRPILSAKSGLRSG